VTSKRKTKIMMAGGLGSLMLALALLLMFVLPATQLGSLSTEAQQQAAGTAPRGPGGMPGAGPPRPGGMPGAPGGGMPGMGMPGPMGMMGMGMGMQAAPAPIENIFEGDPFESSQPNPFSGGLGIEAGAPVIAATRYGPTWSELPLASRIGIGPAQRRPEPEPVAAPELAEVKFMRISSIMWAGDRPLAMYEMRTGESGSVRPGDIVDDWLVEQIGQDYIKVSNVASGEVRRVPLKGK